MARISGKSVRLGRAATIAWCSGLTVLAIYSVIASRGPVGLHSRLGPPLSESGQSTAPASPKFNFAVLGDVHAFRGPLTEAIGSAHQRGCEVFVQLGDFVDYDDEHEYRRFVQAVESSGPRLPIFLVRGNHESMAPNGEFSDHYLEFIPQPRYAFEYARSLFIIADSHEGLVSESDFRWMRSEMTRFRHRNHWDHIFMFMHIPPDAPGHDSPDMSDLSSERLFALAAEHHVDAIFAGHVHDFFTEKVGGTELIVSGCGGGSLRAPSTDVHYLEVTVDGGGFQVQRVPLARESAVWASMRYALLILVPRHRWYVFGGAMLLLVREYLYLRKRTKTPSNSGSLDHDPISATIQD